MLTPEQRIQRQRDTMNEATRLTIQAMIDPDHPRIGSGTKETWAEWWQYFYIKITATLKEHDNDPE